MKVLKIILYVLLTLFAVIALFINISPQFGSNPSRSQKQFFSSFKNFENNKKVIDAGANILVSGTTVFKSNNGDIKKNINFLKTI